MTGKVRIRDYDYSLPPDRIAIHPLPERDQSRLLVYNKGSISHERFTRIAEYIPEGALLVFNNTKVIQARVLFEKETGAGIEVFLLHPVLPSALLLEAMQSEIKCVWKCTIGNLKRWRPGTELQKKTNVGILRAKLLNREEGTVEFSWDGDVNFASIISEAGETPLPPYLKRKVQPEDKERYQTIYSKFEGAVAAPTAGLHFTERVFETLRTRNIHTDFVTLHVSAGTFQPVKEEFAEKHIMHAEQIIISRENIQQLLNAPVVIPVGTTSMRTLESLYWFGVKLKQDPTSSFDLTQEDAYTLPQAVSLEESLLTVLEYLERHDTGYAIGETSIYIMPGYGFRVCDGLVTNFHQPASTLILLVAALIGQDWRNVYEEALANNYRFLSYGDSSLLLPG